LLCLGVSGSGAAWSCVRSELVFDIVDAVVGLGDKLLVVQAVLAWHAP